MPRAAAVGGRMKSPLRLCATLFLFAWIVTAQSAAQSIDLASFEKRVTVHKLKNGLTLVICRRPEAPVFSFFTIVDAGAAQDLEGSTGLAHMMEHEALKG